MKTHNQKRGGASALLKKNLNRGKRCGVPTAKFKEGCIAFSDIKTNKAYKPEKEVKSTKSTIRLFTISGLGMFTQDGFCMYLQTTKYNKYYRLGQQYPEVFYDQDHREIREFSLEVEIEDEDNQEHHYYVNRYEEKVL